MLVPLDVPTSGDLRRIREGLGLSQSEFARALGFGVRADRVIRRWEDEEGFRPTPLAWAAIRYLVIVVELYGQMPAGDRKGKIRNLLPEVLQ